MKSNSVVIFPGGVSVGVEGVFTKTVSDGLAEMVINPHGDDEVILMRGGIYVTLCTGGRLEASINGTYNAAGHIRCSGSLGHIAAAVTNDQLNIPGSGGDATAAFNTSAFNTEMSRILSATSGHTAGIDFIRITLDSMLFATSEAFTVVINFRSKTGKAMTVTVTGGTFA